MLLLIWLINVLIEVLLFGLLLVEVIHFALVTRDALGHRGCSRVRKALLIVILLVRPQGLLGRKERIG